MSAANNNPNATGPPGEDAASRAPVGSSGIAQGSHTHGARAGAGLGKAIKDSATQIHGLGEALRGNFNQTVDGAFNEKDGVDKNAGIAAKGVDEMSDGQYRGYPESKPKNI